MSDEQLEKIVTEKSKDGKIACKIALTLANELNVAPKVIGDACNRAKIRIANCQLGCFR